MKKRQKVRIFIYFFLYFSLLLMMNGFSAMTAEAKENLPVGEMISNGEVKVEVKENWKDVESSNFPVFQGTRIKTEKGAAALTLSNNTLIEVGPKSLFVLDQSDRLVLTQGSIQFRIPTTSETTFKAGKIVVGKSRALQAAKSPLPAKIEEAIGSISIHSNGSVTVKSVQGKLSILNQDRVVLAGLSSPESVTIPSAAVKSAPSTAVAHLGEVVGGSNGKEGLPGASGFTIATQSEGPKGEGSASGLGGILSTIGRRIRDRICP